MTTSPTFSGLTGGNSPRPGGFALVIVMFLLALILILVIAFATNMRTERKAAHNMAQSQRADLLAEGALAHAVSLLADNIPDPTDPTTPTLVGSATNWLINPGQLTLIDSSSPPNVTRIPLHTGAATAQDIAVAANLNAQSPVTQKYYITGTNDPMWVSWVNVLQDATAPASKSNPIVGRYAFWIDDECAKINFNTARGKPDDMASKVALPPNWSGTTDDFREALTPTFNIGSKTYALGQPASVNLDSLGISNTKIATLDADVATNGFFSQPQAIKPYASDDPNAAAAFYELNKFQLTPFSRAPEFNVFGKSRIFMGTVASNLLTGPIYQHLGHPEQPLQFWGYHAGMGTNTVADKDMMRQMRSQVLPVLANYLRRSDWPGMESRMFKWNLSPLGEAEADQIAINLAAMGYFSTTPIESNNTHHLSNAVYRWAAHTGSYSDIPTNPDRSLWKGPLSGKPMLPNSPFPHITEVTCRLFPTASGTTGQWTLYFNFEIELHQPPGNFSRPYPGFTDTSTTPSTVYPASNEVGFNNTNATGGYQSRINMSHMIISVTSATTTRINSITPANNFTRLLPQTTTIPRCGYLPMYVPAASTPEKGYYVSTGTVGVSGTTPSLVAQRAKFNSAATVNVKARFGITAGGTSSLQQIVPIYVPLATTGTSDIRPPSSDDSDAYLEFTFSLPATLDPLAVYSQSREAIDPRILASKTNWPVTVGSFGGPNPAAAAYATSAPKWATWNLDENYIVNESSASPAFRGSSIGMFSLVPTGIQRSLPFETLRFHNQTLGANELPDWLVLDLIAPTFTNTTAPISLRNSTAGKINLNTKIYPDNANFSPSERTAPLDSLFQHMPQGTQAADAIRAYQLNGGYFDYIGRICEVPDVADSSLGATEFEQEVLIRNLASLMTTQSNTFSVWGVAQTVKKSPKNSDYGNFQDGDTITGERRFRAVVERQVWSGKDGIPGNAALTSAGAYDTTKIATPGTRIPDPANAPTTTYANKRWPEIDGPQSPAEMAPVATLGSVPYDNNNTSLEDANNPLAAAMKYRIIFWEYLD